MGWLDNSKGRLAVGQFVTASIQLPPVPGEVAVAESSLIEDGNSTTLFVETDLDNREFSRRKVKVASRTAGIVHIESNPRDGICQALHPGERVLVTGSLGLGGEMENLARSAGKKN